jgi:hypothetical protein
MAKWPRLAAASLLHGDEVAGRIVRCPRGFQPLLCAILRQSAALRAWRGGCPELQWEPTLKLAIPPISSIPILKNSDFPPFPWRTDSGYF